MVTPSGPQPLPDDVIAKKLAEFDSVPLFMKYLPTDETDHDVALAALRSLAHEGTPDEVAQNFKDQGNDYFKGKRYREALGFYLQGVDAGPVSSALGEALLANCAACNLELKNYGSVLRDCSKVLAINPQNSKAYYRSALALLALERLDEASDCCLRCLTYDAENKRVLDLKGRIEKALIEKEELERKRRERILKERETGQKLSRAFKERHLVVLPRSCNPVDPKFDPEDPSEKTLIFPVLFFYPQHATSDMISHFVEDTSFAAQLSVMFPSQTAAPPAWDVKREYSSGRLVVFAMTHKKRLLKIGKKMTLREVFQVVKDKVGDLADGLELKDGCLTFIVLPEGEEEKKWVEEYKRLYRNRGI